MKWNMSDTTQVVLFRYTLLKDDNDHSCVLNSLCFQCVEFLCRVLSTRQCVTRSCYFISILSPVCEWSFLYIMTWYPLRRDSVFVILRKIPRLNYYEILFFLSLLMSLLTTLLVLLLYRDFHVALSTLTTFPSFSDGHFAGRSTVTVSRNTFQFMWLSPCQYVLTRNMCTSRSVIFERAFYLPDKLHWLVFQIPSWYFGKFLQRYYESRPFTSCTLVFLMSYSSFYSSPRASRHSSTVIVKSWHVILCIVSCILLLSWKFSCSI